MIQEATSICSQGLRLIACLRDIFLPTSNQLQTIYCVARSLVWFVITTSKSIAFWEIPMRAAWLKHGLTARWESSLSQFYKPWWFTFWFPFNKPEKHILRRRFHSCLGPRRAYPASKRKKKMYKNQPQEINPHETPHYYSFIMFLAIYNRQHCATNLKSLTVTRTALLSDPSCLSYLSN